METAAVEKIRVGDWTVDPELGQMAQGEQTVRLEPRTLRLLLCLAGRAGQVLSAEQLLAEVWPGVIVTPDSVYQAIAALRRLLGDDAQVSPYIVTVPRKGYRLVAAVSVVASAPPPPPAAPAAPAARPLHRRLILMSAGCCLVLMSGALLWRSSGAPAAQAVAVLPFLDFTEDMSQEVFADGIAEELIGRLSKMPGFHVPPLSVSFQYKGSGTPVGEIARKLAVDYVVDGSVRKSGGRLRVSARLMRTDSGFILWAESFDSPAQDLLTVQDAVARKMSEALGKAIAQDIAAAVKKTPPTQGG
jgi:transcriptional activator of cad operon